MLEGNAFCLLSCIVVSICAFAAYMLTSAAMLWHEPVCSIGIIQKHHQRVGPYDPMELGNAFVCASRTPVISFDQRHLMHHTHITKLHCVCSEGTAIDMDQTSTTAIPAAVRPPAALLALESTSSATGGDGDAGNYRVSCCCNQYSSQS